MFGHFSLGFIISVDSSLSEIITLVLGSIIVSDLACQYSPLKRTYPGLSGVIRSIVLAFSPIKVPTLIFFCLICNILYNKKQKKQRAAQ